MKEAKKPGRNDPCPCGSGKKYKHCHLESDLKDGAVWRKRPSQQAYDKPTLDRNTLDFIDYLRNTLGIEYDAASASGLVARDVPTEKVKAVHEVVPAFFPRGDGFRSLCSDMATRAYSGYYWGLPDLNSTSWYLTRYALYTENIIINNPFCGLSHLLRDNAPVRNPEAWRQSTVNRALFLVAMEPWIKEGIVTVMPPLQWFDLDYFVREIRPVSKKRINSYDRATQARTSFGLFLEVLKNLPPDQVEPALGAMFGRSIPPDVLTQARAIASQEHLKNPVRYAWARPELGRGFVMNLGSGNSLESAVFTATLCGAYLLFGEADLRAQYDLAVEKGPIAENDSLTKLARAFADLEFSFLNSVKLEYVLGLRKEGRLSKLRNFLFRVWDQVSSCGAVQNKDLYRMFKDELENQYEDYKGELRGISTRLARDVAVAAIGGGIAMLPGYLNFRVAGAGLAAFGLQKLVDSYTSRRKHERLPLGVFLDLEKRSKRDQ